MTNEVVAEAQQKVEQAPESEGGQRYVGEVQQTLAKEELLGWYGSGWGKLTYLRCNDIGHQWGSGSDVLYTQVIVRISALPSHAFGFDLRPGDQNLPANLAMLAVLRDAFVHNLDVSIAFHADGNKNCKMRRVELKK